MERVYYRYIFRLKSPLALGSGISDNTDSDVLLDSRCSVYSGYLNCRSDPSQR